MPEITTNQTEAEELKAVRQDEPLEEEESKETPLEQRKETALETRKKLYDLGVAFTGDSVTSAEVRAIVLAILEEYDLDDLAEIFNREHSEQQHDIPKPSHSDKHGHDDMYYTEAEIDAQTDPVDETDTDTDKDKLVSNLLAKGWEDHLHPLVDWESYRRAGNYYCEAVLPTDNLNFTKGLGVDLLYAYPFLVPVTQSFDRIACVVTTFAAGATIRIGIYEDDGSVYPGDLVVDSGELSGASSGLKETTLSETVTPGLYWLAIMAGTNNPTVRGSERHDRHYGILGYLDPSSGGGGGDYPFEYYRSAIAYGALPASYPSSATPLSANAHHLIFLRKA